MKELDLSYEPNTDPYCIIARSNNILDRTSYLPSLKELFSIGFDTFASIKGVKNWREQKLSIGREIGLNYNSSDSGGTLFVGIWRDDYGHKACDIQTVRNVGGEFAGISIFRFADGTYTHSVIDPHSGEPYIVNDEYKDDVVPFREARFFVRNIRDCLAQYLLSQYPTI